MNTQLFAGGETVITGFFRRESAAAMMAAPPSTVGKTGIEGEKAIAGIEGRIAGSDGGTDNQTSKAQIFSGEPRRHHSAPPERPSWTKKRRRRLHGSQNECE